MATTTEEREQKTIALREKALQDTEKMAQKQRFALFSQPPPLSIGDDSIGRRTLPPRDPNTNKPITQPKNITIKAPKSGKVFSSFFSKHGFTTIGDPYVDPARQKRLEDLQSKAKINQEAVFKPASGFKTVIKSSYPHPDKAEVPESQKNYKGEDGKVKIAPSNIVTNPRAKGLFKFREHKSDQYERYRELAKKERVEHYKKVGEKPAFNSTIAGNKTFVKDKQAYGLDIELKPKKNFKEPEFNIVKHEMAFRPSNPPKDGDQGYLNKFPKYMEDPIREVKKKEKVVGEVVFKPNHGGNLTRPTVTISCHPINIRREISNMGSRF